MMRAGRWAMMVTGFALLLSLILLIIIEPWRDEGQLRVLTIEPADRPLARNEPILVRFDRSIHPQTPVEALVSVRAGGRRLATRIRRQDASLAIEAEGSLGWPADAELRLEISPGLAVPFRARDHAVLGAAVEQSFAVGRGYIDLGVGLRLELVAPRSLVALPRGTVFRFRSSLAIDPDCLEAARPPVTVVVDGGDRGQRSFRPRLELGADGRELKVFPWPADGDFDPGLPHRLVVHSGRLRSLTQRSLERELAIDFRSSADDSFEGQLDISFALDDLDPECRRSLGDLGGFARPVQTFFNTVELGAKEEQRSKDWPGPCVFGRQPNRVQILVPGAYLGEAPGLITGFSFFAIVDPADPETVLHRDLILPRVVFRLGEAANPGGGLLPVAALNFAAPGPMETVLQGSREGEILLPRRLRRGPYGDWIDLAFERPFPYRGGARDLVFEVINDGGAYAADGHDLPADWDGPRWTSSGTRRTNPGQELTSLVLGGWLGEAAGGIPSPEVFATKFHIDRYQEVVTRWYEVEAEAPSWFRVPAEDQIDADGREGRDFVLDFEGLDAQGRSLGWRRLEELAGCRRIRARLRFLPDADWHDVGVEVRRLRIRFRDSR
ncbi:MAG: hypothetical protein H6807_03355 [Planctomycetes bacterium]|nr:hypothetical protein [Planctomycetota bacterium]